MSIDALAELKKFVVRHGSRKAAAQAIGVSTAYLANCLNQHAPISAKVLAAMGLKRAVVRDRGRA